MSFRSSHDVTVAAAKAGLLIPRPVIVSRPIRACRRRGRSRASAGARSAGRGVGCRGRADPEGHARHPCHWRARGASAPASGPQPQHTPHAGAAPCGRGGRCLGPEQDVIFRQEHEPGRMGLSDFTDMGELGVTIAGASVPAPALSLCNSPSQASNMPRWFSAARASWRWPRVCRMRSGPWAACQRNIAVTSSLSAAYRNLDKTAWKSGLARRLGLVTRCGITPTRNNRGLALRTGLSTPPKGRSRMRFCSAAAATSKTSTAPQLPSTNRRRNAHNRKRIELERPALIPLPRRRTADYEEKIVTVTSSGGFISACGACFTPAASRLIGHRLRVPESTTAGSNAFSARRP